ncbi:MAG: methionyl-tRNA formyltransferase [Spirochaetes bacterium]|nr:methionyl-tRNA formyltransferase [Spirochaetota bacterium]
MKIGFFGTPEIASYSLTALSREHEIVFAVTCLDKPQGRSQKVCTTPVKTCADDNCIALLQTENLKDPDFINELKCFNADIFVVVAFGYIIPESIFKMPRLGTVNLHPSLLPKYRGAAPVQWALINGENETGVTIQMVDEKLDSGDIVLQEKIPVSDEMNSSTLYDVILPLGADMLLKAVKGLDDGSIKPVPQNHEEATYCRKIDKAAALINWSNSAGQIHNLVRGLNPKPAAWTEFRDKNMKIWKTRIFDESADIKLMPGELMKFSRKRLLAGTGEGIIEILELQPENKKIMDALSFINGSRLAEKEFFKLFPE